jgi:phosphoglycerol transferase
VGAAAAALIAAAAIAVVLRLWQADLTIPFASSGDALFNAALAKGLLENGWWTHNAALGFPAGLDLHDFAMGGDHLHVLGLLVLAKTTGDAGLALNLYWLLAIPLSAVTAYAVLRWLGVGLFAAVACSVLFAVSPYALLRGETHLTLAAFPVPLGAWLVLAVGRGERLLRRRRTLLLAGGACVVVGSTGSFYFPLFTLALLVVVAVGRRLAAQDREAVRTAAAVTGAVAAVMALNLLPTIVYSVQHGRNAVVAQRFASESEFHALKLAQLVLPVEGHRIGALARLRERYGATAIPPAPTESDSATLGAVGTVGLVWLLGVLVLGAVSPGRSRFDERHRLLAGVTLVAILIGTMGGLGSLFAYLVSPQLRGWNRISVFILFFALAAIALLIDRATRSRRVVALGLSAFVLVVGLYDQTTPRFIPPYLTLRANDRSDGRFVAAIEARVPAGASILQLPPLGFPESPPVRGISDYEPLRGYLQSRHLRWSYGAMRGRPADWQTALTAQPPQALLAGAAAVGAAGIWVDRAGYPAHATKLEADFARRLGSGPQVESDDGRFAFFATEAYAASLARSLEPGWLPRARAATLRPLRLQIPAPDVKPLGREETEVAVSVPRLHAQIVNPGPGGRRALVTLTLQRRDGAPVNVTLTFPGGVQRQVTVGPAPTTVRQAILAPSGTSGLDVDTNAEPLAPYANTPGVVVYLRAAVTDALLMEGRPRGPRGPR